jgi:hypothetical protein
MGRFLYINRLSLSFLYIIFIFCGANSASAEVLGGLEFEVPSVVRNWQFAKRSMNGAQIREYSHDCDGFSENFLITYTKGVGFKTDYSKIYGLQSMIEKAVKQSCPTQEVVITMLGIEPKSIFYKTVISNRQVETAYSWTRELLTEEGAISFRYVITHDLKKAVPLKTNPKNADNFFRFLSEIK